MTGPIDAEQLGRLLDEHGSALALYAAQWTDSPDDCVQEALVALARQRLSPEHVVAWLYRVVKHRALNAARGDQRLRERESRAIAELFPETDKSAAFDRDETIAATDALVQLEPRERELVVMRIWGNLTYEEIGAALNVSIATAHRQYAQHAHQASKYFGVAMYDEQETPEHEIAPELRALERQLRGITPTAPRVDRDRLMFAAGQASASTEDGQDGRAMYDRAGRSLHIAGPSWAARRFWPAATLTMTAATLLLATMLVWQRQTNQFASQGDAAPPSTNLASDQPRVEIPPSPDQSATSSSGSLAFQRPSSGYLGIRYAALTRGVSAWESSSQASTDDADSSNDTPRTQRKMLEEFLPSRKRQINPSF